MKKNLYSSFHKEKQLVCQKKLVLFNDEYNSFDHVIDCLIAICEHNFLQAEQCALIAHNNGSCVIKTGELTDLLSLRKDLGLYNLDVKIL